MIAKNNSPDYVSTENFNSRKASLTFRLPAFQHIPRSLILYQNCAKNYHRKILGTSRPLLVDSFESGPCPSPSDPRGNRRARDIQHRFEESRVVSPKFSRALAVRPVPPRDLAHNDVSCVSFFQAIALWQFQVLCATPAPGVSMTATSVLFGKRRLSGLCFSSTLFYVDPQFPWLESRIRNMYLS